MDGEALSAPDALAEGETLSETDGDSEALVDSLADGDRLSEALGLTLGEELGDKESSPPSETRVTVGAGADAMGGDTTQAASDVRGGSGSCAMLVFLYSGGGEKEVLMAHQPEAASHQM